MKLIWQFMKPHWKLLAVTVVLLIADVAGALFIPTLAAQMLNQGTSGSSFEALLNTGIQMAVISVLAGVCAILGGYACATLSARVGKDMRAAIYEKSLKLSVYDFRQFGTASITTRTVSDITTIQFAITSFIQMVLPVPVIFIIALVLSFNLDIEMGFILLAVVLVVLVLFFLMMVQMVILTMPRALECCSRVQEVLEHTPEIRDLVRENPGEKAGDEVLAFRKVSFRFADAEEDTLKNLNFTYRRGETTAIIGGTGSGKSTVASLILRFHEVTEGSVCLNGTDIRDMTQAHLRDHLAYVQQKAWLFSGTIADNLRYSRKDASEKELMHAADVAQAGEFIRSLPQGLSSYVAQGGTNFSGGQKQRLSIARALVKRPELYIFDDSFSALDFKTDAALRKALAAETKDAAVLIIAQRVSTIRHASQIVVLHEGEMAGIGTHEELLEDCPVYREIYESQTKEAQEE